MFASFENKANFYAKVNTAETYVDFEHLGGATFWEDFTLPSGDGAADEILYTDGSDELFWDKHGKIGKYKVIAKLVFINVPNSGSFGSEAIVKSYNVSSISGASSKITVNFTDPTITTDYLVLGFASASPGGSLSSVITQNTSTKTTSSCVVTLTSTSGIPLNRVSGTILFLK